jgi:hypothetical protein
VTLNSKEKRGGSIIQDLFRERMEDLITKWDMNNIKPSEGKLTWKNWSLRPDHITTRLEIFIVQSNLILHEYFIKTQIIPLRISDQKPISLQIQESPNYGPLPFHYNFLWLQQSEVVNTIFEARRVWITGSLVYIWEKN